MMLTLLPSCLSIADVPAYELSETTSVCIIASIVNTLGAAEGVLRGAANGQDWKLFGKARDFWLCSF
jgi:hypothetical protein